VQMLQADVSPCFGNISLAGPRQFWGGIVFDRAFDVACETSIAAIPSVIRYREFSDMMEGTPAYLGSTAVGV
jgi:hypothetical protein